MAAIPETGSSQELLPNVTNIAAFSKGFVCSGGAGFVHLFEKTDEKDGFKKTREIKVPVDSQSPDPQASIANQIISTLTVSPSEETLVCSTKANQMYSISMSSADLGKVTTPIIYMVCSGDIQPLSCPRPNSLFLVITHSLFTTFVTQYLPCAML
jgi:hypothetical protein